MPHSRKGKRKATGNVSSSASSAEDVPDRGPSTKKSRRRSPVRVKKVAMAKAASKSGSSSKGLASFESLINNSSLTAAQEETNRGLRSSSSSKGSSSTRSRVDKPDPEAFSVGTIVFLVVGVKKNSLTAQSPSSFPPVFCLRSDADISPMTITGMKQSGLCVMDPAGFEFRPSDGYATVEEKLRKLFPRLFDWLCDSDPSDSTTSPWLICVKSPHQKNLAVYSDDQRLPTGKAIIEACHLAKGKSGIKDRCLYLVTRECVPMATLNKWRPSISSKQDSKSNGSSDIEDSSSDSERSSPLMHSIPFPLSQRLRRHARAQNDEQPGAPDVVTDAPTPPHNDVDTIKNSFSWSMNFDDEDNPWL